MLIKWLNTSNNPTKDQLYTSLLQHAKNKSESFKFKVSVTKLTELVNCFLSIIKPVHACRQVIIMQQYDAIITYMYDYYRCC